MTTHILYIPGLGDGYDTFRRRALKGWNRFGVRATLVPSTWYDGGELDQKMRNISTAIDRVPNGERIVLIGESAGASLALLMATRDARVSRVITLCGVATPDTTISAYLRQKAPALNQAVKALPSHVTSDVHCVRAFADGTVRARHSVAKGAKAHVVWSIGHLITIAACLTVYSSIMIGIAKKA